jgi:hypothetical protein
MTQRQWRFALMFLGVSLAYAAPAQAQRSGFIIGFGLGPGLASYSSVPDRESKIGVAFDFHIGGVIGDSFELYYVSKGTVFGSDLVGVDVIGSGVGGLGFGYWLNPKFSINGAIGFGTWVESRSSTTVTEADGVGFLAGGRYLLSESGRWGLGFDITYGKPFGGDVDFNALGVQATINVLSH